MSLFDVIKYGKVDIMSKNDLDRLPQEVVNKWRARVVEHACKSAESIAQRDKSGTCQELIDMTRKFMRGEVSMDAVNAAISAANYAVTNASYCAASAANAARKAVDDAAVFASDTAFFASNAATASAASDAAMKLYQEWITEELLKHESDEFCD